MRDSNKNILKRTLMQKATRLARGGTGCTSRRAGRRFPGAYFCFDRTVAAAAAAAASAASDLIDGREENAHARTHAHP